MRQVRQILLPLLVQPLVVVGVMIYMLHKDGFRNESIQASWGGNINLGMDILQPPR